MKKNIYISILLSLQALTVYANDQGFRGFQWETDMQTVRSNDLNGTIDETQEFILSKDIYEQFERNVLYIFDNNKLCAGMIILKSDVGNENLLYEEYLKSENVFLEAYGDAFKDNNDWLYSFLRGKKNEYGFYHENISPIETNSWTESNTYISNFFGRSHWVMYHITYFQRVNK